MAKFIMSIGEEAFKLLGLEAKNRDVTLQQLLRAVVVPEWIKQNMNDEVNTASKNSRPPIYPVGRRNGNDGMLPSPVNRLRH